VSGMFKPELGAFSLVWPLGEVPGRTGEIVLWDLRHDPEPYLELPEEELRRLRFLPSEAAAGTGPPRLPAKTIRLNRCPVVVRDLRLLTPELAERYQAGPDAAQAAGQRLAARPEFRARVLAAYAGPFPAGSGDPDF